MEVLLIIIRQNKLTPPLMAEKLRSIIVNINRVMTFSPSYFLDWYEWIPNKKLWPYNSAGAKKRMIY